MTPQEISIPLTPPQAVEATTALVWPAEQSAAPAIILAHGAGTDMRHRHMQRHASDLADRGVAVALFNFGFTEAGRSRPDPAPRAMQAWRDVLAALRPLLGAQRRLTVGGRSFGGRMASMVAAESGLSTVDGVACIAYPLHPPGRPERLRIEHWPQLARLPLLLISGDRDAMAPLDTLRAQMAAHLVGADVTLHVVAGADHSFRVRTRDGRSEDDVLAEVADVLAEWLHARAA